MSTLTIFRGLPGSGKTTRANELGTIVLSPADMYSTRDGKYCWTPEMSEKGRKWAMEILEFSLLHEIDITVAEVLPKIASVMRYVIPAIKKGYKIKVIDCESTIDKSFCRNVYGVPIEAIKIMDDAFEPWNDKFLKEVKEFDEAIKTGYLDE